MIDGIIPCLNMELFCLLSCYVTTMLKKTFSIILMVCCVLFAYFTLAYVREFYIGSQNDLTVYAIESLSTKVDTEGKIELGLASNIIQAAAEPHSWLALIDILIFLIIFFIVFMFCVVVHYERKIEKSL